jgi:hypothetical protein
VAGTEDEGMGCESQKCERRRVMTEQAAHDWFEVIMVYGALGVMVLLLFLIRKP